MAYTLYLYKEFPSKSNKTIRLEIFQKDYVGSAIEIEELAGNPIILNTDNSANDIDVPIIKTSLSINIIDTNQFDYSIFFTPDATKFKVIVKVSGTPEWTGFLTPDSFVQAESYRSNISLLARDNIGMLAEFEYDGTQLPVKINTTINNAFTKINFGGILEYRVKKLDNDGVNILNDIVNGKLFVGKNYYEVVEILLRGIGCQLRYVGGNKYAIFDIADLKGYGDTLTAQTFLFIEQSGAVEIVPARKSIKITQDYGLQESIYDGPIPTEDFSFIEQRNAGLQYLTYRLPRPPVPAEQQDFYVNYYTIPIGARWVSTMALLEPTYFQRPESSILITGTNTESIVGLGKLMYSRAIPETNRDTNLKITVDVSKLIYGVGKYQRIGDELALWDMRIGTSNSKLHFRCNFFFDDGTTIQYLSSGGWREKPLDYADRFDIVLEQVEDESSTDTPYQTLEFNLGNADSAGTLTMEIYPYWLENNTLSLNVSAYVMELRDFDIKFVRLDEKIGGVESVGVINNDYNLAAEVNLSIGQVPNYLGNNLTMLAGIFQDASYYPPAFDFHRPSGANYKLFELIGREIAHHYKTQKNKLTGTIINSLNFAAMPSFGKTFTDGVKNYALNYGALDFRNETMQVELIEVEDYVTEDYTFIEATIDTGGTSLGSGETEFIQWSAAGNAKRIHELDTASESDQGGAFVFIDKSGLTAAKKVPISSLLVDAYTKTESDSRFASIDGDLTQDFSAKKLTTATLLLPQSAPTLDSGEVGIYSLDSGFSGEVPSGAGSVTSIALTMPTGFSVSGSPITESGTFGVTFASGYFLPTTTQFATKADVSLIGAANGIAPLDSGGKVALQYLPSTLLKYMGVWDASTNTPTLLATDTNRKGQVWNVSVAGTQFGITFSLGDWLIYNDSGVAEKSDNSDDVVSVNGYTGAVTLKTSDIAEQTNLYYTDARVKAYADTLYTPLAHASATNNPHSVTAAQVGALALTGGSVTGTLNVSDFRLPLISVTTENWSELYNQEARLYMLDIYGVSGLGTEVVYGTVLGINGMVSHDKTQLIFNGYNGHIQYRKSWYNNTAWGAIRTLWDSSNLLNIGITASSARTALELGSAALKSDTYFALLAGNISQPFSASKLTSTTLLLPQSAPTLASGEMAIYGLESGFSGELPSGAGSVTSISMVVPTGLLVTPATITESGTFTISYASGYSIPTNTKQGEWDSAYTLRHNAVTLGTANGLSLSTQELSLGLASTSTNGALSSTDWNTFNSKAAGDHNHNGTYALLAGSSSQAFSVSSLTMNGALTGVTNINASGQVNLRSFGADVFGGAIEIRERSLVTSSQTEWSYSPSITFHWGGLNVVRFGLKSDGNIAVDNYNILHAGNYSSYALPLSGGIITHSPTYAVTFKSTNGEYSVLNFRFADTSKADIGYLNQGGRAGTFMYNAASNRALVVNDDGKVYLGTATNFSQYEVIHSGNIGSQSVNYAASASSSTYLSTNLGAVNGGLQYWQATSNPTLNPDSSWWYALRMGHGDADTYYSATLAISFFDDVIKFRRKAVGGDNPWQTLWHTGNLTNTLTSGYLPYWNGSSLVNSNIINTTNGVQIPSGAYRGTWSYSYPSGMTLSAEGTNISIEAGWNSWITLSTGASGYENGLVYIPYGKLGIGSSANLARLDVNVSNKANEGIVLSNGGAVFSRWGMVNYGVDNNTYIGSFSNNAFLLYSAGAERMRIASNGNVGIGYTDRSEKFAVNGSGYFNTTVQMTENINTNLRIPKVAPTNPTSGEYYFYIVE